MPIPTVISVPPLTTDRPITRAALLVATGAGLSGLGVGGRLPRLILTTAVVGGRYAFGVSSLSGTIGSGGRNATFAGKSLFTSAAVVCLNAARSMKSAASMRPSR